MKLTAGQILALGAVGIVGSLIVLGIKSARDVKLNPGANDNVISNGVTEVVEGITGRQGTSLGSELFDLVQRIRGVAPYDPNAPLPTRGSTSGIIGGVTQ